MVRANLSLFSFHSTKPSFRSAAFIKTSKGENELTFDAELRSVTRTDRDIDDSRRWRSGLKMSNNAWIKCILHPQTEHPIELT